MILRPQFITTPLQEGLQWRGDGLHRFEEKLDGQTHVLEIGNATLWGELMPNGDFYAVDVLRHNGEDTAVLPRRESLGILDTITARLGLLRPAVGHGGEFLEAVLAAGGEGLVASLLSEPFAAPRWKAKRSENFVVTVLEKHAGGKSSVRVGYPEGSMPDLTRGQVPILHGQCMGWVPLHGVKFDLVRVGSVLKVTGFGLTKAGKIREPRPDKDGPDSWLLTF